MAFTLVMYCYCGNDPTPETSKVRIIANGIKEAREKAEKLVEKYAKEIAESYDEAYTGDPTDYFDYEVRKAY